MSTENTFKYTPEEKKLNAKILRSHKIIIVTGLLDIVVIFFSTWPGNDGFTFFALTSVGIITFLGVLVAMNSASRDIYFSKGEIRNAIASSILIFYFTIGSLFVSEKLEMSESLVSNVITPFSWVLGSIIAFYFGSVTLDKLRTEGKNSSVTKSEQE